MKLRDQQRLTHGPLTEYPQYPNGEFGEAAGDDADAVMQGGHQHVEQPADPGPIRRRPQAIALLAQEIMAHLDARQMAEQQKEEAQVTKLLVLGTGESGKSTIFKQMKIINKNGYTKKEKMEFVGDRGQPRR